MIGRFLAGLGDRIQRYPVLFFGAAAAWIKARVHIETGGADDLALTATVLWLQSAYSVSKKTAEERTDAARSDVDDKVEIAKYVGAVEQQATTLAGQVPARRPLRPPPPEVAPADMPPA